MKHHIFLFCLLLLAACQDDFIATPTPSNFLYSGSIRILQEPQILMDGESYSNDLQSGPLQVTVSEHKETDQIQFTIYGKQYQIYEADFWIDQEQCIAYNDLERVLIQQDENGNDVVKIFYPDTFWKNCYFEDGEEQNLVFLIKSRKAFY